MAVETEKNTASGSTVIDENRGRDDLRQNPKKRGMSKDVVASLDQRVVDVKTSMTELKNQVEGLEGLDFDFTNSFMGEITKIREDFGDEVSTLHQVIEVLQADMALCMRSLASSGDNTNHCPKIDVSTWWKMLPRSDEDRYIKDTATACMMELGMEKSARRRVGLQNSSHPDRYVSDARCFTTLVLEIPELSDQDSLFYFLDGLQGWAKTELERRGVQDLSIAIAYVEALIEFSTRRESSNPKDWKVNQDKGGGEKNAQPKVDPAHKPPTGKDKNLKTSYKSGGCFICDGPHRARDCPKKASLNSLSAHEDEEASDGGCMGSIRILNAIKAKTEVPKVVGKGLQYVEATINGVKVCTLVDFGATHNFVADDEAKRLGINATKGSGTIKAVNSLAKAIHGVAKDVQAKIGEWEGTIDLWWKDLHVLRMMVSSKMEVPKVIERVLDEFKDVMPKKFPKKLPPRRELDHTIELEMGSKPPAKAPYRMPPPELEELRNQLKELIDTGYSRPSKAPYGAPMLF
ncbi:putative retrotransposon gag domain, aspartic peptidase domain protein [Tanacetum coccineum]